MNDRSKGLVHHPSVLELYNDRIKGLVRPLFIFGLYGVLGILLDLDHLLSLLTEGRMGRPAHIGGVVVAWLVCFVGSSFVLRLLYKSLGLTKGDNNG